MLIIPIPHRWKLLHDLGQFRHILIRQLHLDTVLPDPLHRRCPWDGNNPGHAGAPRERQHPVDRHLGWGTPLTVRNLLHGGGELQVRVKHAGLEPREGPADIALGDVGERLDLAAEDAPAEGSWRRQFTPTWYLNRRANIQ